jgi:hypothetical protein
MEPSDGTTPAAGLAVKPALPVSPLQESDVNVMCVAGVVDREGENSRRADVDVANESLPVSKIAFAVTTGFIS